ncbi:type II toxin-antitoxin system VapC family toxin [Emticicia sp.]|uniref:type II toxin-antitoxin system VapC family toxin n=1 Tax=Emticicia sp. TaxID=1930953 RepID=UPI0037527C47
MFPLDNSIVYKTIELRRLYKIKLPDAIIAATAIVFDFTLISRNDKDFENINGLKYYNPF